MRNRQIERAKRLLAKDPEEIKKGPNDVKRFLKRIVKKKSKENVKITYVLDQDKIAQEEKYDGFYAIATNLDDPAKDILEISHKRYQIEDCFRVMKTNFLAHPVNHYEPRRIQAHFLICFTSLLVFRLLEHKLNLQKTHVTAYNIITTLKNMNVVNIHDVEYMALYNNSSALSDLVSLCGLCLNKLHYRPKDLNRLIKKILN